MKSCLPMFIIILYLVIIQLCFLLSTRCETTNKSTSTTIKFLSVDELVSQIIQNQSNITNILEHDFFSNGTDDNNRSEDSLLSNVNLTSDKKVNLFSYLPRDFMNPTFRQNGGFILHILIFLYLCMALTLAIDFYFVPSLQYFSLTYNLSPNIIGSTLMVLGTSLPELFTSIINVFVSEASIGTGAIVVSSIFNLLAIPGFCGLTVLSIKSFPFMPLNSWPLRREIIFYSITIIVFILGIKDDSIDCIESLVFIFIYVVYMFCLYLWSHFEITQQQNNRRKFVHSKDGRCLKYTHYLQQSKINMKPAIKKASDHSNKLMMVKEIIYDGSIAQNTFLKYPLIPFKYLFLKTIPKASKQSFIGTYFLSSIWIVVITYFLVWMISIINKTFHFTHSSSVMTMMALGNITKLISSIVVVKRLHLADMAICHIIGSNIFNILICLGLPWFLKIFILIVKEGLTLEELQGYTIPLDHRLFEYVATSLTLLIVIFILIFYLSDWNLTIKTSYFFIIFYIAFLVCLFILDQYIPIV